MLFVDRSSNQHDCGMGLILWTPTGDHIEYAVRTGFKATNNEAEYESLLAGLRVAIDLGVDFLDVLCDSQLVGNQVQEDYLAKNPRMVAYLDEVKAMTKRSRISKFAKFLRKKTERQMLWLILPRPLISS